MNVKLTFINKDIENYSENNVIIEKDNGERILTKYNEELEELLSQEIIVDNLKNEKIDIYKKTEQTELKVKKYSKFSKDYIKLMTLFNIGLGILCSSILNNLGLNHIKYTSLGQIKESTLLATFIVSITSFYTLITFIDVCRNLKSHKNELKKLNAKDDYLYDKYNEENKKLEKLKTNINNNEKNIQLDCKTIDPKDELEKIKEELNFYYNQGYYSNDKNNEISKSENKQLIKQKDN